MCRCLGWLGATRVSDPSVFGTELGARRLGEATGTGLWV